MTQLDKAITFFQQIDWSLTFVGGIRLVVCGLLIAALVALYKRANRV